MAMKSGEHVPSTPSLISYLFTASFCFSRSLFAHLTTLPLSRCLVSRTIKSPFEIRGPEIVLARNFFQIYVNKIWSFCFKMGSLSTMAMLELGTWNWNWWKLVRQAVMQYCNVDKRRGELMRVKPWKAQNLNWKYKDIRGGTHKSELSLSNWWWETTFSTVQCAWH